MRRSGAPTTGQQPGHDRAEQQLGVGGDAQVHGSGKPLDAPAAGRASGRGKGGATLVAEEDEGQGPAGFEVGHPHDQLAEAGLAEVLAEQAHQALPELGLGGRRHRDRGPARDFPEPAPQAGFAGCHVGEGLESLQEAAPVLEVRGDEADETDGREDEHGQGQRAEVGPAQGLGPHPEGGQDAGRPTRGQAVDDEGDREEHPRDQGEGQGQEEHGERRPEQAGPEDQGGAEALELAAAGAIPEPTGSVELGTARGRGEGRGNRSDPGAHHEVDLDPALVERLQDARVVGPGRAGPAEDESGATLRRVILHAGLREGPKLPRAAPLHRQA